VQVWTGTWDESVSNWTSGTIGHPIWIKGQGLTTIWHHIGHCNGYTSAPVNMSNKSYIRISNFNFDGTDGGATFYSLANGGAVKGLEILNNFFSHNGNDGINEACTPALTFNSKVIYLNNANSPANTNEGHIIDGNAFDTNKGYNILLNGITANLAPDGTTGAGIIIRNNTAKNLSPSAQIVLYSGLEFVHAGSGSHNIWVYGNETGPSASGGGLKFDATVTYSLVELNKFHDMGYGTGKNTVGIEYESDCHDNTIQFNQVYRMGLEGIRAGSYGTTNAARMKVIGNTIWDCPCGIVVANSSGSIFQDNIISLNTGIGNAISTTDHSVNNIFRNNIQWRNGAANVAYKNFPGSSLCTTTPNLTLAQWSAAMGDTGSIWADPKFVSVAAGSVNLNLQASSPAIRAGFAGNDMGALQSGTAPDTTPPSAPTGLIKIK
jgi:parallel beta-helix repeat protein